MDKSESSQNAKRASVGLALAAYEEGHEKCLNDEQIAELIDHPDFKLETEIFWNHIASCDSCYEKWHHARIVMLDVDEKLDSDINTETIQTKANTSDIRAWLKKTVFAKPAVFGSGLAAAAMLLLAIIFNPVQQNAFDNDLNILLEETQPFSGPTLLGLVQTPGTRVNRSAFSSSKTDLAFKAGLRATFGQLLPVPNTKWDESLNAMQDVLPECLLSNSIVSCTDVIKTAYAAGQWTAITFTHCNANKTKPISPAILSLFQSLIIAFESQTVDASFVTSFNKVNANGPNAKNLCVLTQEWIG